MVAQPIDVEAALYRVFTETLARELVLEACKRANHELDEDLYKRAEAIALVEPFNAVDVLVMYNILKAVRDA